MFHVITGVVISFAAALVSAPRIAAAQQSQPLIIKGSLTYLVRIALPPDSRAVVELRDAAAPEGARGVAEQHIDLKGRQVPVPFQLSVDRAKLASGKRYVVRGAIVSGGRPTWASKDIAVDSAAASVDLGMIRLTQVKAETALMCGSERIEVSFDRDVARVIVGGRTYEMKQVKAASGAKYEVPGDPTTSFWNKGRNGTLVLKGKSFPECTPVDPAAERLQGGTWVVQDIRGTTPVEKSRVTLNFGQDGRVSGNSSCNSYSGSFKIAGDNLTIGQTIGTMKACADPLMKQEQAFLGILRAVQRFEIRPDGTLVLHATDKRSIAARRENPPPK
jgi:heat shock protein HslJ/uncharacterized lipoprotein YbaY